MITLTINGVKMQAEEGASVLGIARANGIWIPSLCHHDSLTDYGACRLCLVEIAGRGGWRKVTTSCTLPAADGLEVVTESERLTRLRRTVMELILAGCPQSKAILEMAEKLGVKAGRLEPNATSDCILCGQCIRACREISKAEAISFGNRGVERKVTTPFGEVSPSCILCGACVFVCPTGSRLLNLAKIAGEEPQALLSRFDADMAKVGAIARPFPQAVPNVPAINREACLKLNREACGICETICEAKAICYQDQDKIRSIPVGAIVATPGIDPFVPDQDYGLGYTSNPDVVTSMEFERILSASGPFGGHVVRPSDGRAPRRIAFLQCVGSRDVSCRNGYCSSVCCMYAVKEAIIAKEHERSLEATIFVMDVRAFGKDFDKFVERAKSEYGIVFKYARVSDVVRDDKTGANEVVFTDESGKLQRERFDLVVLSVGLKPSENTRKLARALGARLNEFGFVWTEPLRPLATSRTGLFAAGAATGPRDIPETVIQASAAACEAARFLAPARNTLVTERAYPPERDIAGEPARIGVFICHCGINIGGVVDVPSVKDYAATLPGVAYADHNLYTCSQDTQKLIKQRIDEHRLNRVVVASCSPRTHEALFQETMKESGLNPHLFVMANIRDQCSWVHQLQPEKATDKAKDLVRMATAMARLAEPLKSVSLPVTPTGLVLGGGLSGLTAALAIADQGFDVCLVEKEKELGGNLRKLYRTLAGQNLQTLLRSLLSRVEQHPRIQVHCQTVVKEIKGFVGNFETALSNGKMFKHGAVVVATGAQEYQPVEYEFGRHANVVTQLELSRRLEQGLKSAPANVVMIQCIGSREEPRQYCSRVCCSKAIQNAIQLKELYPDVNVHILYRDLRTYGFRESFYAEARDKGVLFTRFELNERPAVIWNTDSGKSQEDNPPLTPPERGTEQQPSSLENPPLTPPERGTEIQLPSLEGPGVGGFGMTVRVKDPILGAVTELSADLLVLSTGMIADIEANDVLAKQLKVPLNQDGFFLEAHVKLRPVEFATEGVYVAGLAHSPKAAEESIAQALAAASRACVLLSRKELEAHGTVGDVDPELCTACGLCEKICPFGAVTLEIQRIGRDDRLLAQINPALCKGCGACSASCRGGAITLRGFTDEQILAEIKEF